MFPLRKIIHLSFCIFPTSQSLSDANSLVRNEEDLRYLLQDVNHIWFSGALGWFSVFGQNAFPVVGAQTGTSSGKYRTLIAGARHGPGRIIAAPHNSFVYTTTDPAYNDLYQFLINIVNWLSPGQRATKLATFGGMSSTVKSLFQSRGIEVTALKYSNDLNISSIATYDALIIRNDIPKETIPLLLAYLEMGKGLLLSPTAWNYGCCSNGGIFGAEYPGNQLASKAGFSWSQRYGSYPNTPQSTYNTSLEYMKYLHLSDALKYLKDYINGDVIPEGNSVDRSYETLWDAPNTINFADIWEDKNLYNQILDMMNPDRQPIPTVTNRVTRMEDKISIEVFKRCSYLIKPQEMPIHPASEYFPGKVVKLNTSRFSVPAVNTAKIQVKKYSTVRFETADYIQSAGDTFDSDDYMQLPEKRYRWVSTGLYAPAGDVIKVDLNSKDVFKYFVQIGCHSDWIGRNKAYNRIPSITFRKEAQNNSVVMASPYGGLIYVDIPSGSADRNFSVTITGGVKAPHFKLGETSVEEWQNIIRYRNAPWAEFSNDKLVISVPSVDAVKIDNPTEVMELWDRIMDGVADLAGIDPKRTYYDDRFVADVQISAGALHSGYPIMSYLSVGRIAINFTRVVGGSCGHFHEFGHNHQNKDWTFAGTGETTCNIFTLFVYDTVLGIPFSNARFFFNPEYYQPAVKGYIDGGRAFDKWKPNYDLSLLFYVQIQRNYGWDIYKRVFRKYRELGSSERPCSDQDKMDLWLIMLSKDMELNFLPFFESWGFSISEKARGYMVELGYPDAQIRLDDLYN